MKRPTTMPSPDYARSLSAAEARRAAFLAAGCYHTIEDWARDSDYEFVDGQWWYDDPATGDLRAADIVDCLDGAIEASGWQP